MNRPNQNLRIPFPVRPYMFILKEGKEIKQNRLDYSLMLLQTGRAEVIGDSNRQRIGFFIKK